MAQLFLKILNMSLSASYVVLAVLLLRLVLKKAPRWIMVVLWGIVAIRLICPFSVESMLSLIPSAEVVSPDIMMDRTPQINTGIPAVDYVINPVIGSSFAPDPIASVNPLQIWIPVFALLWGVGMAGMQIYMLVSYVGVKRKTGTAVSVGNRVYQSENVASPFVLGILKPKIYLPYGMKEQHSGYVIAHERAHIRRKDHLWKPLGFLLLTLHWFNPLMWLGYVLLCRDIELACDEKVIKELDREARADYSQALLTCSVTRRMIAACPLAFGEVDVKHRIRSVLHYKKPALWLLTVALVTCVAVSACLLTDPQQENAGKGTDYSLNEGSFRVTDVASGGTTDAVSLSLTALDRNEFGNIRMQTVLKNHSGKEILYGEVYGIQYEENGAWVDSPADVEASFAAIAYTLRPHGSTERAFLLDAFYDVSRNGRYRLLVPITVDEESHQIWLTFSVLHDGGSTNEKDMLWLDRYVLHDFQSGGETDQYTLSFSGFRRSIDGAVHLSAAIHNHTEEGATAGYDFTMQYLNGDVWEPAGLADGADVSFPEIAWIIEPGKSIGMSYEITLFDLSRIGTYRLLIHIDGQSGYDLWIEFQISEPTDDLLPTLAAFFDLEDDAIGTMLTGKSKDDILSRWGNPYETSDGREYYYAVAKDCVLALGLTYADESITAVSVTRTPYTLPDKMALPAMTDEAIREALMGQPEIALRLCWGKREANRYIFAYDGRDDVVMEVSLAYDPETHRVKNVHIDREASAFMDSVTETA